VQPSEQEASGEATATPGIISAPGRATQKARKAFPMGSTETPWQKKSEMVQGVQHQGAANFSI